MKIGMTFNGRKVTSTSQLSRELTKAAERALENGIRKAAGPGVRVTRTPDGYLAEGPSDQIDRLTRRLR